MSDRFVLATFAVSDVAARAVAGHVWIRGRWIEAEIAREALPEHPRLVYATGQRLWVHAECSSSSPPRQPIRVAPYLDVPALTTWRRGHVGRMSLQGLLLLDDGFHGFRVGLQSPLPPDPGVKPPCAPNRRMPIEPFSLIGFLEAPEDLHPFVASRAPGFGFSPTKGRWFYRFKAFCSSVFAKPERGFVAFFCQPGSPTARRMGFSSPPPAIGQRFAGAIWDADTRAPWAMLSNGWPCRLEALPETIEEHRYWIEIVTHERVDGAPLPVGRAIPREQHRPRPGETYLCLDRFSEKRGATKRPATVLAVDASSARLRLRMQPFSSRDGGRDRLQCFEPAQNCFTTRTAYAFLGTRWLELDALCAPLGPCDLEQVRRWQERSRNQRASAAPSAVHPSDRVEDET